MSSKSSITDPLQRLPRSAANGRWSTPSARRSSERSLGPSEGRQDRLRPPRNPLPGEAFVQSAAYQQWIQQHPSGGPSYGDSRSEAVTVGRMDNFMGLRSATITARTLITSIDTSAGDLVQPLHRGLIEPGLTRPLSLRDLVTVIPVSSDAIEYVKEISRVNAAVSVAEATALTGTSGTKPEGGLVFDIVQDTIKTFAVWVPATKRILQDAVGLQRAPCQRTPSSVDPDQELRRSEPSRRRAPKASSCSSARPRPRPPPRTTRRAASSRCSGF
jgi:hypothetical protein